LCSHSSDSSRIRFIINLFPESWCGRLNDTAAQDAAMAERDHEAALFQQLNSPSSSSTQVQQPGGMPAMTTEKSGGAGPSPNIRDKAHILSDL